MAHFFRPPNNPLESYDVDGRLAPDSVWRMRIPLPGSGQIGIWGGRTLWIRSTNTGILPAEGIERSDAGDVTLLRLSPSSVGDCRLEAGYGAAVWVSLEVQAGVTAVPDGNFNVATRRGTYEGIDAAGVTRRFHDGRAGIELLGGSSRGYMRWIEIIGTESLRESSGPPPGFKPVKASLPWETFLDRPKLLVLRQGWTFQQSGMLRDYYLEVWWLPDNDTEYQVLEGHAKRAALGDQIGYGIVMRPFCGDVALFQLMKVELAHAIVQGAISIVVSATAWKFSVRDRTNPASTISEEASASLRKAPPARQGIRVLLVGPETEEEFQYAQKVNAGGGKATAVNPMKTPAADSFVAGGGQFIQGKVEALPQDVKFDIIREDFPYPTGNFIDVPAVNARISRLNPGGSWVMVTEKADFADAVEAASKLQGAKVMRRDFALGHEAAPVSAHPRDSSRIALVITRD